MTRLRPPSGADPVPARRRRHLRASSNGSDEHGDRPLDRAPWRRPRAPRAGTLLRWLTATVLLGLAAVVLSAGSSGAADPTTAVLVAARDLAPGVPLAAGDVRTADLPRADVPAGALRPGTGTLGRRLTAPARRGEPLTDVRLMGPALVRASDPGADVVAAPVRVADPGVLGLVHPGDRVDVLAVRTDPAAGSAASDPGTGDPHGGEGGDPGSAVVVATDVVVLTVPAPSGTAVDDGALVVLATTHAVAARLAAQSVHSRLSLTVRGR